MKLFLRKKNIVSAETLHASAQYDIDTAWRVYYSHSEIYTRLFGAGLITAAVGIGCFIAGPVLDNFIPIILGLVSYAVARTLFTLSANHNKQSSEFNTLSSVYDMQAWMEQQELIQQEFLEEFGDPYFEDDYFDRPSWLYGKPAESKSQFEIET
jgi:hypothetical protein